MVDGPTPSASFSSPSKAVLIKFLNTNQSLIITYLQYPRNLMDISIFIMNQIQQIPDFHTMISCYDRYHFACTMYNVLHQFLHLPDEHESHDIQSISFEQMNNDELPSLEGNVEPAYELYHYHNKSKLDHCVI